ncbi:nitrous oxide reductase accessory protein NosL [Anaeromyxobacter sp. Fw109-5]|uniref:nitrous oxide reductase accessory protein NosL n=1 Tax=Anaeromyxobacter sp. (strain Fw109-5) TaxID=404589 RepID=UPI0000ED770D|nr:nitrous oxide reductase accessory protein NosL [Anaeromyxobacter sp. Fw109-5]ABS24466.1 conserved hypothetical protein [Anaeromyxobacter sp. Fw109-5]
MRNASAVLLVALSCSRGPPAPAPLDTRNDACAQCRMAVSDPRFAAQLVAAREEPRFFDDIGCLRDFLRAHASLPDGAVAYVADHRTRAWVRAAAARYTRDDALATPMSSHLVAHADDASRAADPEAARGVRITVAEVFGPGGVPDAR